MYHKEKEGLFVTLIYAPCIQIIIFKCKMLSMWQNVFALKNKYVKYDILLYNKKQV